jgi:hypothetical protein
VRRAQGSAFYLSGAALVIIGWTVIGLCVEAYGFWLLFCEFIPTVLQFSRRVPFLSKALDLPFLKVVRSAAACCLFALIWGGGAGCFACCVALALCQRMARATWPAQRLSLLPAQVLNKVAPLGGLPTTMEEGRSR